MALELLLLPFAADKAFLISSGDIVRGFIEMGAYVMAIVLGVKAKREVTESGGQLTGGGLATAGFVLGIVGLALSVLALVLVLSLVSQAGYRYRGY
jgi:hypothetical protein